MHVLMGFIKRPLALYKTSKQSETITFACKKLYVSLWNNINNIIDPQASTDEYVLVYGEGCEQYSPPPPLGVRMCVIIL